MAHETDQKAIEIVAKGVAEHLGKASPEQAANLMRNEYLALGSQDFNAMVKSLNANPNVLIGAGFDKSGNVASIDFKDRNIYSANETSKMSDADAAKGAAVLKANLTSAPMEARAEFLRVEQVEFGKTNYEKIVDALRTVDKT